MMKEVVRALETGAFAQVGLVAFFVAFVLILVYTFTLTRQQREALKNQPLENLPRADGGEERFAPDRHA